MILHPTGRFNNHAKSYKRISAVPLASAMGAEIRGVNLSSLDDEQFSEIEDALYRHKMIYFRNQDITLSDQEAFTLRLGTFGVDAYTPGIVGHPNVQKVVKEADARVKMIFGSGWHTDSPFLPRPPAISILFGADIPPFGGDTIWANSQLAYEFLSETMQKLLAPLRVHMSARNVLRTLQEINPSQEATQLGSMSLSMEDQRGMIEGSFHPLVRTHPATGTKALFVDYTYSSGIQGLTEAEARALLDFLVDHVTQPAFTCRLRWEKHTLAVWDNRSCLHQAFNDHDGYRREMYRTTVLGEGPS
jgi:alpha-ketoglutarate-dependent taurine dioxygenase